MYVFSINGSGVEDGIGIEPQGVLAKVFVAAADDMTPPADGGHFGAAPEGLFQAGLFFFVRQPDGIIEVVDDLLPEHLSDEPFHDRWSNGGGFAVDEDPVVGGYCEEDEKSAGEPLDQESRFFEGISRCVEDAPGAFGEEALDSQPVSFVSEKAEILFEPEPLGRGLFRGIGNEEENSGHDGSGSCK